MKSSPLKYNGGGDEGGFGSLNNVIPRSGVDVPSNGPRINSQPIECNKTRIGVCKNSLHLRWGMEIRINDQRPVTSNGTDTPVVIESITYSGIPGDITANIQLSHDIDDQLSEGLNVTFHGDRNLNFNPNRKITGLNVIDGMIYWTDNYSEPKKVNIERGKEGSKSWKYGAGWDGSLASIDPYTWPGCASNDNIACYSDFDQHTKLIVEDEHIMDCENSTSTCYTYGCTDPLASNYNPTANYDDGSCIIPPPVVYGCDNGTFGVDNIGACNSGMQYWSASVTGNIDGDYNTNDTALCIFADDCEVCDGAGGVMFDPNCSSCNDSMATNYSGTADDCQGITGGLDTSCCRSCLDPTALNYYGSTNTYDCSGTLNGTDYSSCCTYPAIQTPGCTDPAATNFDPNATVDDGSCTYPPVTYNCVFEPLNVASYNMGCVDPGDGTGEFQGSTALVDCQDACVEGCTDLDAYFNTYNPLARFNPFEEMMASGFNQAQVAANFTNPCEYCNVGCMDSNYDNYDPNATCDEKEVSKCCDNFGPIYSVVAHAQGFGYGESFHPYMSKAWMAANIGMFNGAADNGWNQPFQIVQSQANIGLNMNQLIFFSKQDVVTWANFVYDDYSGSTTSPFTVSDTFYAIKQGLLGLIPCSVPNYPTSGDCNLSISGGSNNYWGAGLNDSVAAWEGYLASNPDNNVHTNALCHHNITPPAVGCTWNIAINPFSPAPGGYDPGAAFDDGSCCYHFVNGLYYPTNCDI